MLTAVFSPFKWPERALDTRTRAIISPPAGTAVVALFGLAAPVVWPA